MRILRRNIPPLLKVSIGAVIAGLIIDCIIFPLLDGRLRPPEPILFHTALRLIASAESSGAREYAPERLKETQATSDFYLQSFRKESARIYPLRNYRPSWRLMLLLQDRSLQLFRETIGLREKDREEILARLGQIESGLTTVNTLTQRGVVSRAIRTQLAMAEIKKKTANSLLQQNNYRQALKASRESSAAIAQAEAGCRDMISRYTEPENLHRWDDWLHQAVSTSRHGTYTFVVIKDQHRLDVYRDSKVIRSMDVDLGANSIFQKLTEGDRATPEGIYRVTKRKGYGASNYGLALLLDYPNAEDRRRFRQARSRGEVFSNQSPGGLIEIHGQGGRGYDWTDGCIAPSDNDMQWLFTHAPTGTLVVIIGSTHFTPSTD